MVPVHGAEYLVEVPEREPRHPRHVREQPARSRLARTSCSARRLARATAHAYGPLRHRVAEGQRGSPITMVASGNPMLLVRRRLLGLSGLASRWRAVAAAQETVNQATVSGRVVDPQGAAVPGAVVSARQTATNVTIDATTDAEGRFRFSYPGIGHTN